MIIEYFEYAPDYVRAVAAKLGYFPKAYSVFVFHQSPACDSPLYRDRTEEMSGAVKGMSGVNDMASIVLTREELKHYGYEQKGARYNDKFKFIFS